MGKTTSLWKICLMSYLHYPLPLSPSTVFVYVRTVSSPSVPCSQLFEKNLKRNSFFMKGKLNLDRKLLSYFLIILAKMRSYFIFLSIFSFFFCLFFAGSHKHLKHLMTLYFRGILIVGLLLSRIFGEKKNSACSPLIQLET